MARALPYCPEAGVVHRDVKPANVLIEDDSGRPVLVDFGLIKRDPERMQLSTLDRAPRLSRTGEMLGTPKFMAPEQASSDRFGEIGPHTDARAA